MRDRNGLGTLEVRVRRHERVELCVGLIDDRALHITNEGVDLRQRIHGPEARARRHLIVAAASGVESTGRLARLLMKETVDEGVHVFVRGKGLLPRADPLAHTIETGSDSDHVGVAQHTCRPERRSPGLDKRTSKGQSRMSVPMDRFTASSSGAGPPAKRPPQSLCCVPSATSTPRGRPCPQKGRSGRVRRRVAGAQIAKSDSRIIA